MGCHGHFFQTESPKRKKICCCNDLSLICSHVCHKKLRLTKKKCDQFDFYGTYRRKSACNAAVAKPVSACDLTLQLNSGICTAQWNFTWHAVSSLANPKYVPLIFKYGCFTSFHQICCFTRKNQTLMMMCPAHMATKNWIVNLVPTNGAACARNMTVTAFSAASEPQLRWSQECRGFGCMVVLDRYATEFTKHRQPT